MRYHSGSQVKRSHGRSGTKRQRKTTREMDALPGGAQILQPPVRRHTTHPASSMNSNKNSLQPNQLKRL